MGHGSGHLLLARAARRTPLITAAGTGMLLGIPGCGSPPHPPGPTIRDSSGVRIVEYAGSPWQAPEIWTVGDTPQLELGGLGAASGQEFDRVSAIARTGSGHIVVADASAEIRIFRPDGSLWRRSGRPGDGPGEYRLITAVGEAPADSLWVYDFGVRRFSVLDAEARFVRSVPVDGALSSAAAIGRAPNGSFLVRELWSSALAEAPHGASPVRAPTAIARLASDGTVADTVVLVLGRETVLRVEAGRSVMSSPLLARSTAVALHGAGIVVGTQESFVINRYDRDGNLGLSIRAPEVNLEVSDEDIDLALATRLAEVPERERTARRLAMADIPWAPFRPAYQELHTDTRGRIWVGDYAFGAASSRWVVFDPAGILLGSITVPERFSLFVADPDWILGVWRDHLDVEHVRLYGVRGIAPD